MFLFEEILSIDYGSGFIKGILFKKIPGEITILQSSMMEIISVKDGNEYEYNLNRFLNAYFPNARNFITNIPVENLFIRDMELPVTSAKTLKEIIPFEVESVVPFPMEQLVVLYKVWKTDENSSKIVTFNSHHDEMYRILHPFIEKKASLKSLSVDSCTLASLISGKEYIEKTIGQLDIGHTKSIFNVCYAGHLCFTRVIPIGGANITSRIAKILKTTDKKAEEIKKAANFNILDTQADLESKKDFQKQFKLTSGQMNAVFKGITDVLREIAAETIRSIYSLPAGIQTELVYLYGGGNSFEICEPFFTDKLGITASRFHLPSAGNEEYINCYGNITHYLLSRNERTDFLTSDYAKKINIYSLQVEQFKPHIILSAIALLVMLSVFITGLVIDRKKINANEAILAKKFESGFGVKLPEGMNAMDAAKAAVAKEFKNTEIFRKFYNKPSILDVILEITNHYPSRDAVDFQLDQFVFNNEKDEIMIYGKVNEFAEIGTLQDNLSRSELFKNISVINKSLLTGGKGLKVKFQMKLEIAEKAEEIN